jgi:tetratricopeptide (TPR) repeat protein
MVMPFMPCPHCGSETVEGSRFCPSCGNRISRGGGPHKKHGWWWLLPVCILLLIGIGLGGYFYYQQALTKGAVDSFKTGEALALKGKYNEAISAFNNALEKRPHFPNATFDKKVVSIGLDIKSDLVTAKQQQKDKKYDQALTTIERASQKLRGYKGKIVDQIKKSISDAKISATVGKLRQEMEGKTSIDDLAPILSKAEDLNIPEGKEIANQIRKQIVEIAYSDANKLLNEKQFTKAMDRVNAGLKYDAANEKLLSLKTAIQNAKDAYEKEEEQRIHDAMEQSATELEHNKNDAVKLVDIKATLDDYGNVEVTGRVKSTATVPITTVSVTYTLYDESGNIYDTTEVIVMPDTLNPGDEGTFDYTHFNVNEKLTVKATHFKWYLTD